jgi:D-3-phosphoglycerate dehydrogenase
MRKTEVGRQLDELTLGIVGFGRIGKRLGHVAHALGMNLWVCDVLPEVELRKAVAYPFEFRTLEEVLGGSQVVTLHVDGRPSNRHLLDADAFATLRNDALLINAARGMLIEPAAAQTWLSTHPQAHAYLDVHDPEPPTDATQRALHEMPNVTPLPHLASRTDVALRNMSWVVRDVAAVLAGNQPTYPATAANEH